MPNLTGPYQAVLLEDSENPWIDDIDGYDRFQRTAPSAKGAQGPHIYDFNPRKPNAGKQYLPIRYQFQEYPKSVYQPRLIPSREISEDLAIVAKAPETKRQDLWDKFMDRLLAIELEIDFRQLALPEIVPDATALRMLRRTLVLQVQTAEAEAWKAKNHPKTFADYKVFINSPLMRIVKSAEEEKAAGRGWFASPSCEAKTEVNVK